MNNLSIIGRLGSDARTGATATGTATASFSVAVETGFGDHKTTQWFNCKMFGKRAENGLIPHLIKGQQVGIVGEVSMDEWKDRMTHEPKAMLSVVVRDVTLLAKPKSAQ